MITKIAMGIGIIAALLAAEGSNRFGSFVSASIVTAGVLLGHFFGKKHSIINYVMVVLNAISALLLLGAPMIGVVMQIFLCMIIAGICLLVVQFTYPKFNAE
jgi:hypothetical protein